MLAAYDDGVEAAEEEEDGATEVEDKAVGEETTEVEVDEATKVEELEETAE